MAPACPTGPVVVHPAGGRGLTDRSARACHHGRMPQSTPYRSLSYWLDSVPGDLVPADPLPGDLDVDVAIAGAGFTGLWTAYYLATAEPGAADRGARAGDRRVRRVRPQRWLVLGAVPGVAWPSWTRMAGRDAAVAMYRAMQETVDEVGRVAAAEGIDCDWAKGGTVHAGPVPGPAGAGPRGGGRGPVVRLRPGRPAAAQRGRGRRAGSRRPGCCGATYTPHCAAIHPARLARGLAERACADAGCAIYERHAGHRDRAAAACAPPTGRSGPST